MQIQCNFLKLHYLLHIKMGRKKITEYYSTPGKNTLRVATGHFGFISGSCVKLLHMILQYFM